MQASWAGRLAAVAVLVLALPAAGCLAAAAGGAAAGIYLTTRGAEALVEGSVDEIATRTEAVFREMEITQTGSSTERSGDIREVKGTRGDLEITARIERESPMTAQVEVTARQNVAQYDKEYARDVLRRIVERGGGGSAED